MRLLKTLMTLALPFALLTGCTAGNQPGLEPGEGLAVEVKNGLIPSTSVTVWMVSDTGTRKRLGTVSAGETDVLSAANVHNGPYRLMAETTAGDELWSNQFYISDVSDVVSWSMSANLVTVSDG